MPALTPFGWLVLGWTAVTAALVVAATLRTVRGFREEDQLFLAPADAELARRQEEVLRDMNRLSRYVNGFGAASAAFAVMIIGLFISKAF